MVLLTVSNFEFSFTLAHFFSDANGLRPVARNKYCPMACTVLGATPDTLIHSHVSIVLSFLGSFRPSSVFAISLNIFLFLLAKDSKQIRSLSLFSSSVAPWTSHIADTVSSMSLHLFFRCVPSISPARFLGFGTTTTFDVSGAVKNCLPLGTKTRVSLSSYSAPLCCLVLPQVLGQEPKKSLVAACILFSSPPVLRRALSWLPLLPRPQFLVLAPFQG